MYTMKKENCSFQKITPTQSISLQLIPNPSVMNALDPVSPCNRYRQKSEDSVPKRHMTKNSQAGDEQSSTLPEVEVTERPFQTTVTPLQLNAHLSYFADSTFI